MPDEHELLEQVGYVAFSDVTFECLHLSEVVGNEAPTGDEVAERLNREVQLDEAFSRWQVFRSYAIDTVVHEDRAGNFVDLDLAFVEASKEYNQVVVRAYGVSDGLEDVSTFLEQSLETRRDQQPGVEQFEWKLRVRETFKL